MHPLRIIKRFLDKIFGTKSDELSWKFRHFFDKNWAKSYISEAAINHPHRKILIEEISKFYPFESVLEVGSASGANLFLLAKKYPESKFFGIDVSLPAINEGKKFFEGEKIKNVFLEKGSAQHLEKFTDKSMDVIFSDAAIIYVGPDKIDAVFKDMSRIAKTGIVLCEQHTDKKSFYNDRWIHNYSDLVKKNISGAKINFTKIPKGVWGGDWEKYGYIIKIVLQK
jgi:ubiquinone/menaquinone biosynthesis C-methylase UbiE